MGESIAQCAAAWQRHLPKELFRSNGHSIANVAGALLIGIRLACRANSARPRCAKRYSKQRHNSNHRKRARHFCAAYEPIDRIKVFDRDLWRCQICRKRTPKKLMGTFKDNAPEVDHRIPMALGGGHVWENVQCACRRCNQEKGGTKIVGQLPLFDNPNSIG